MTPINPLCLFVLACAGVAVSPCLASTVSEPDKVAAYSSSASLPDAPDYIDSRAESRAASRSNPLWGQKTHFRLGTTPFSEFAIGTMVGPAGLGVQIATPLATKINLRVGASFLSYHPDVVQEGFPIDGDIQFRNFTAGVDVFPYRGTFHITPGVTMYNGNTAHASTFIAGGQAFTINDTNYVSSPNDPVHGTFDISFGRKLAPSLTVGFGNMLRRDSHWSMPFDIGFQYIGAPKFVLNMQGSVCDIDSCNPVQSDPGTVSDLKQEQTDINHDISLLRFYPIVTMGLAYRFGHVSRLSNWH